jgi:CelD/BcsL family acetyltransferase involved in cellulose biosynthesis
MGMGEQTIEGKVHATAVNALSGVVTHRASVEEVAISPAVAVSPSSLSTAERETWRDLLGARADTAPFVDEDWVTAWTQAFRPREPLLVCDRGPGQLVGLGAVQSITETWAARRLSVVQSLTNVESPRFEFLARDGRIDILERLWRALCDGQWDVIRMEYLPMDSPTLRAGITVADQLGWSRVVEPTLESPWRSLPRTAGAWDEGLKRKFKSNLRNRERRLQALGDVTFSVAADGAARRTAFDLFYALEASGWKGQRGTAIARRTSAKAFYDNLEERTGQQMWVPILSVAGRPAAAQLIRVEGRTLFLLKTAYDPEFAPYAPGQLLTARLIRYGIEHGMDTLDFLGDHMTWKADWEPRLRQHCCLMLFAPSGRGRYAYWTRYGLREHAKKIPGATRLVRWLRSSWQRRRP